MALCCAFLQAHRQLSEHMGDLHADMQSGVHCVGETSGSLHVPAVYSMVSGSSMACGSAPTSDDTTGDPPQGMSR
eukprot:762556-Hanusia_phi.AAC.3